MAESIDSAYRPSEPRFIMERDEVKDRQHFAPPVHPPQSWAISNWSKGVCQMCELMVQEIKHEGMTEPYWNRPRKCCYCQKILFAQKIMETRFPMIWSRRLFQQQSARENGQLSREERAQDPKYRAKLREGALRYQRRRRKSERLDQGR